MSLVDRPQTPRLDASMAIDDGEVGDYFALMKPRVMSLVVFTALVGMVMAPSTVHPVIAAIALLCIAVGAGASGALNMWYDADIDRVMGRTAKRPVPAGRIGAENALGFGLTLAAGSVIVLGLVANWLAASLLAFTIFFYAVVYTMWLKRSTPQNIVIGGAAGAFPPVIGWAAVTGDVGMTSLVLFAIIFMWTPPHFWALSLVKAEDYRRAGVPMLPCVAGQAETRRMVLIYSVLMAGLAVVPWAMGAASLVYGLAAVASGLVFIAMAAKLVRIGDAPEGNKAAIKLFVYSIFYLFGLFAVLLAEGVVGMVIYG
ncbi:MAG: heme o synthase [Pseudomonadota bacterium]